MKNRCSFCQKKQDPTFKDYEQLAKFLTHRGKIVAREKSNVCSSHQRKLAQEIKKARVLALMPFVIYES